MKTQFSILALSTLLITLLLAQISSAQVCRATMPRGKYRGQCIDTTAKRAIQILDQSAETVTIANYRKNGRFYKAVIPVNEIVGLSYVIVDLNASPLNSVAHIHVSHTEMRFKFAKNSGVELYQLDSPISSETFVGTDNDFLISLNYMAPPGVPYDPVKGFDEELYASALQVFSMSDEVDIRFKRGLYNLYEIALDVPAAKAAGLLKLSLRTSDHAQYNIPYDSWSSNCTTILFDLLDASLRITNQRPYRFSILKAHDTGMIAGFRALGKRRLVNDETTIKSVNAEFGYPTFPSKSNRHFVKFLGKTYKDIKWPLL